MERRKTMAFIDLCDFHSWPMGGMLSYELQLLPKLASDYELTIYGVSVNGIEPEALTINGKCYPVHVYANVHTGFRLIPNYLRGRQLRHLVNELGEYDIVYAHTASCLAPVLSELHKRQVYTVFHQHGLQNYYDHSLKARIQLRFVTRCLQDADLVFAATDEKGTRLIHGIREKSNKKPETCQRVISPINDTFFDGASDRKESPVTFVYTGRFWRAKRTMWVLQAFEQYRENDKKARLWLVGDGEDMQSLKEEVEKKKLQTVVKLPGVLSPEELASLLQRTNIYVTASAGEGNSVAVAEALATGNPTVCFRVSGLEGQIVDGKTGIFASEESIVGLADAMKQAVKQEKKLRVNCEQAAEQHRAHRVAEGISNCIEQQRKVWKENPREHS